MTDTVLVTGGAGYIGSVLVEQLLRRGWVVTVLDNLIYTDMGIRHLYANPNFSLIPGDIRDNLALKKAVQGVDCVIHLAAIANDPSGDLNPALTRSVNLDAYLLILTEAEKTNVKRFINASTFSVYGVQNDFNVTEESQLNPLKEYSICKAEGEKVVKEFNKKHFVTTSLRCATVCGWSRRQRFDLIVNTLTAHALCYKKITVLGGEQRRPQIHILDLVNYMIQMLVAPSELIGGEVFNAGAENTSIMEIAEIIRAVLGNEIEIETASPRDDERSYHVDSSKLFHTVGLQPEYSIQNAVQDIANAYAAGQFSDPFDSIYHNVKRMKDLGIK